MRNPPHAAKRICLVTHSYYESDNRIIRYAQALAARGDHVEVVALRRSKEQPRHETLDGVQLHRIQDRLSKAEGSKWSYLWPVVKFLLNASMWLVAKRSRRHFDLVHVHNIPDFLVFCAWYQRLRGAPVVLDIHDIVPEFFGNKFGAGDSSPIIRALRLVEKLSAAFASHVILANHLWLERYVQRSAPREKCSVFLNYVDEDIFTRRPDREQSSAPLILFPGGLQWHQGLDIAIRAFAGLVADLPDARFHIYGDGGSKEQLEALVDELGLSSSVTFFEPLPIHQIAEVMATADLAVVPKRADSFGNEAYSTKIMEFMSLGVPVVASRTRIDQHYFNDDMVCFFESGNHDDLTRAMREVLTTPSLRASLVEHARGYVEQNNWSNYRQDYFALVDGLIAARR